MTIAAGIVVFHPDHETLLQLVDTLAPQVAAVQVFVNQAIAAATLRALRERAPAVEVTHADENLGVGEALNFLVLRAALAGHGHLVLFDQDSRPDATLVTGLHAAWARLTAEGERVAAVGPAIVSPPVRPGARAHKPPRYWDQPGVRRRAEARPVRFLITSGTLLDLSAFRAVGPFRADYFIDGIDLEWCLRAWARGYSCWCVPQVAMAHTIGAGTTGVPGLFETPLQSDLRMYTYSRNTAHGWRLAHVPLWWKARSAAYLALQSAVLLARRPAPGLARALASGLRDGLAARLGPPGRERRPAD